LYILLNTKDEGVFFLCQWIEDVLF
jgi:hypothetical protein